MSLAAESPYKAGTILALQRVSGVPHLTAFAAPDMAARGWMHQPLYTLPSCEITDSVTFMRLAEAHAHSHGFRVRETTHNGCLFAAELIVPS